MELEKLNSSTDNINKLEIELDVSIIKNYFVLTQHYPVESRYIAQYQIYYEIIESFLLVFFFFRPSENQINSIQFIRTVRNLNVQYQCLYLDLLFPILRVCL